MRWIKSWKRPLVPLAILTLSVVWATDLFHPPTFPASLLPLIGLKENYEGVVRSLPVQGRSGLRVKVLLDHPDPPPPLIQLTFEEDTRVADTLLLMPGDRISFTTRLKKPVSYKNPGSFDYRKRVAREGIFLSGFVATNQWQKITEDPHEASLLQKLRQRISQTIGSATSGEGRAFLKALLVDDRSELFPSLWEKFRATGTAHLIAISGQHVVLVAGFFLLIILQILKLSRRLMLQTSIKRIALLLTLLPVFVYVAIAGAPPSAIRAAILCALGAIAWSLGREPDIYSALALAAILIVLWDPASPFDPSFQLSFTAVLALALFVSPIHQWMVSSSLSRWTQKGILLLTGSIVATIGTAPLVAFLFHQVSLSGILTNLWAIPAAGLVLGSALLSLMLSFTLPPLGLIALRFTGWITDLFLKGLTLSADYSWVIPFYPTEWDLIILYALLASLAGLLHYPKQWRRIGVSFLFLMIGCLPWGRWTAPDLRVTFLDVGQGDSTLIEKGGKAILIDGGGFLIPNKPHSFDVGGEVVVPFLKRQGIRKIDLMILSHPHPDHYGGLEAIAQTVPVKEFWWNGQAFPDETFDKLLETLTKGQTIMHVVKAPYSRDWNGTSVEVLFPTKIRPERGINNNCLVISLTSGKRRFLFAGDIEKEAEGEIADFSTHLEVDVLKIPHHGSRTSSSIPFIDKVRPRHAVASLGDGNMFHFPHPGVLEKYLRRDVQVWRTDLHGAITVSSDGQNLEVSTFQD